MAILSRFCALRLADTVTAATPSHRKIEAMALELQFNGKNVLLQLLCLPDGGHK